jgi:phosphatidylglycerophosphate synthase
MIRCLVIAGTRPMRVGGLTLTERAVRTAARVGLAAATANASAPFEPADDETPLVVIGPDVLVDAAALTAFTDAGDENTALLAHDRGDPTLLFVPARSVRLIRSCRSIQDAAQELRAAGPLRDERLPGRFCRRVTASADVADIERDFIRHLNGPHEAFFTKIIRRSSVPVSARLIRLGATPTLVTSMGLAFAVGSAWSIAQGTYWWGLVGSALYYASMVLDCSDGEVARTTLADSGFGAWLETAVDYSTYFMLLAALVVATADRPAAGTYRLMAIIALAGSLVVAAVATFLRRRVARADPGQFDDSSAAALRSAGRIHRFARWGRQWIKRSTIAHLVVALALVGELQVLLLLWAFGATLASAVILAVAPFVVRRVHAEPLRVHDVTH